MNIIDLNDFTKETIQELDRKTNGKIIIFGAAYKGVMYTKWLMRNGCIPVSIVDNDEKKHGKFIFGIKVQSITEAIKQYGVDCFFIFTVSKYLGYTIENFKEIEPIKQLLTLGCHNFCYISGATVYKTNINYLKDLLNKYQINTDNDLISYGNFRIKNFLNNLPLEYSFFICSEFYDLINPIFFRDFSDIDEGPYEYGDVYIKRNDVVMDCGANYGVFSTYAASFNCKVYAFEPIPKIQGLIKENIKLYGHNITLVPYALSNEIGDFKINVSEAEFGSSSMVFTKESGQITVKTTTIDEFVKINNLNKVDFIKADIEGAERDMLKGSKETLKKFAPKLAICTYHYEDDKEVLESIIKEANPNYIVEHKWRKLFAHVPEK